MKNPITIDELSALLNDNNNRAETLEYYFEYVSTGPFTGEYQIKSFVQIVNSYTRSQVVGVHESAPLINLKAKLLDNANNIARKKRDQIFENRKKTGNKVLIVTEGDSWFQYPKYKKIGITLSKEVKDVIDYIIEDERFAVKSLDAAADVIKNMFHENEYIDSIRDIKPRLFILSGGGNDFFAVFSYMLQKGDGVNIESYLKDSWQVELEVIKTYYKGILDVVTSTYPNTKIILHGYDYIMPNPNGKWIGKPMIKKGGLTENANRKKLIQFIMDKFNENIMNLSTKYKNVHFVDIRGTVPQRDEFWHDEIHPNNHGFSLVADKFISKIDELLLLA